MTDMIATPAPGDEYVTIIARSINEAMGQFRARGLDAKGYSIVGQVNRHVFAFAEGPAAASELFDGNAMVAATFRRPAPRS